MEKIYASVDIGGSNVRVALSNREGFLRKVTQPTELKGDNTAIPQQVEYLIGECCKRSKRNQDYIKGIGISTCSPFSGKGNVSPNLCGGLAKDRSNALPNDWTRINLIDYLMEKFIKALIEQGNDCITANKVEYLFGAAKGEPNNAYVTRSTGIGAGAHVDGNLILGKYGNALHFGHIIIDGDSDKICGCGQKGDLEALASGTAIARDGNELVDKGDWSEAKKYGLPLDAEKVYNAARQGDEKALGIINQAARYFGKGLASLATILDTKIIVLGGSIMNDWDLDEAIVKEELYEKSFKPLTRGVTLRKAELGDFLGDMAGLSLVMPKEWVPEWDKRKPWKNDIQVEKVV